MADLNVKDLKEIVERIVLSQGNKYIKELLRDNDVQIGKNKEDFLKNIFTGIDDGKIDQAKIDAWLEEIEGWGDQHVYLFSPPHVSKNEILGAISASKHSALLAKLVSYEFPAELSLRTINLTEDEVTFGWKQGRDIWLRAKSKDYQKDVGGENFEFRAFRETSERQLARFSWKFGTPHCAAYLTHANERGAHDSIFDVMWEDLKDLGFCPSPLQRTSLTSAFNSLNKKPELKVNSVRMNVDGGHVNLVATAPKMGIHDVAAIRQAQLGIDVNQFTSSDGVFHFNEYNLGNLSRPIKVEGSGTDSRIRLWAQCTRRDVSLIVNKIIESL
jgi:hypothetical protein